jgi:hypothetical protein
MALCDENLHYLRPIKLALLFFDRPLELFSVRLYWRQGVLSASHNAITDLTSVKLDMASDVSKASLYSSRRFIECEMAGVK